MYTLDGIYFWALLAPAFRPWNMNNQCDKGFRPRYGLPKFIPFEVSYFSMFRSTPVVFFSFLSE
jgi:hypothetical protein